MLAESAARLQIVMPRCAFEPGGRDLPEALRPAVTGARII